MVTVLPDDKLRFRSILEGAGKDASYDAMFVELQEGLMVSIRWYLGFLKGQLGGAGLYGSFGP